MMHTPHTFLSLQRWLLGLMLAALALPAFAARDIKRAEEVFLYSARATADTLLVTWDIEPGHYLYRDKMKFKAPGAELGAPRFPAGEVHADEFFGEQIIFRGRTVVEIPYTLTDTATESLELELRSQGCADWGLCYPPQRWSATVAVPAAAAAGSTGGFPLGGGRSITDDSLPPEQAFMPSVSAADPFTLEVRWDIAPGYYLYRKDFAVTHSGQAIQPGALQLPDGVMEADPEFGDTEVYYDSVVLRVPFTRASPAAQTVPVSLAYQGCKKGSICYPPATVTLDVNLPVATATDLPPPPQSEQDRLFGVVADASLPTVMMVFLGLGLLLAFTPCCLPMVPILSGIIAGQGDNVTTARSFWLSLSYVLGMAFTYTLAGAVVGAVGGQIQAALQTPLILGFVALLFVGLSLAMFGLYELQMPAAIQTRLSAIGGNGGFIGTAVMGAISALVVSTCVAPPLVAALAVIAQTGDVARGAFALFSLSIGMGIPLLVFGTSAGKLLPKAGPWMNTVKGVFGLMLLGLAIWMLDRVLPAQISMLLWAALAVFAGVWLGALTGVGDNPAPSRLFGKGTGLVALVYGVVLFVGALSGSSNPLQPLDRLTSGGAPAEEHALPFDVIKTVDDFEAARTAAAAEGKHLMLDFYADWCVSCKEMEAWTFTDAAVQDALADTVLIQADVTANDDADQALLEHFGIFGPPTIVFYDRAGREVTGQRVVGYMATDDFLTHLSYVLR